MLLGFVTLWVFLVFYLPYKDKKENTVLYFRSAVTRLQALHGSMSDYFIELSDGSSFLFKIPNKSLNIGDSIIKIKGEKFFTVKKSDGRIAYKIGVNGKIIQ